MDLMSLLNAGLDLKLKSEEEVLDEFLEEQHVASSYPDSWRIDQKARCGRVLVSSAGEYTVECETCNGRFDGLESLSNHLKTLHSDCGVQKGGWFKVTIKAESACEDDKIDERVYSTLCPTEDAPFRRIPEFRQPTQSAVNVQQNIVTKENAENVKLQRSSSCSYTPRKPTVILSAEPIYDEQRLFCITCDRQLKCRKNFLRHKYYHKERLRKQGAAHLNHVNQKAVSTDLVVKDEVDFGDYEIQDSEYNDGRIKTADADDKSIDHHAKQVNAHSRRSHGNFSVNSCGEIKQTTSSIDKIYTTKGATIERVMKLEAVNPDEKMALVEMRIPQSGTKQGKEAGSAGRPSMDKNIKKRMKIVFSENLDFDEEKNICITCNRVFSSKNGFNSHKFLHKKMIRIKQATATEPMLSCEFCSEQFKFEFDLREHTVMSHGDSIPKSFQKDPMYLKCRFCHEQFEKPTERRRHEKDFHTPSDCVQNYHCEKKSFACDNCGEFFTKRSDLTSHKKTHAIKTGYNCEKCGELFTANWELRRHTIDKHEFCDFQCTNCEKRFKSHFFLMTHIKYTTCGEKMFQEGKLISTEVELQKHMTELSDDSGFQYTATEEFERSSPIVHRKLEGDKETYYCTVCDENFTRNSGFQSHMQSHEQESSCEKLQLKINASVDSDTQFPSATSHQIEPTAKVKKTSLCEDSSEQIGTEKCQQKETFVFTLEPEYAEQKNFCITCSQQLSSKETFRCHRKKHASNIRYWKIRNGLELGNRRIKTVFSENPIFDHKKNICVTCHRTFASKASFSTHKFHHTRLIRENQLRFCCELCPRRFKSDFTLREHLVARHEDEIPELLQDNPTYLQCRFCFKQFEEATQRCQHEQSHAEEEKPYQCGLCPKSFTNPFNRKIHKLNHKENGWKPKELVRFVFSENPNFDDKKRFCITCNRGFASKYGLNVHKRRHQMRIREKQRNLPATTIFCIDPDAEQMKSSSNLSVNSRSFPNNCSETTSKEMKCKTLAPAGTHVTKQTVDVAFGQIESVSSNENISFYQNSSGQFGTEGEQMLKSSCGVSIVLEPEFDEEKRFCVTCDRQLDSKKSFRAHKDFHKAKIRKWKIANGILPKATISCEFCSGQFRTDDGLRRHVVRHHGNKIPTSLRDDPTYLQCRFCFKHFEKPTERYEHEKTHASEDKRYHCPLCPKSFIDHFKRKIHELLHRENRWKPKNQVRMVFSENPKFDDKKRFCVTCNHHFVSSHSFCVHKRRHRMRIREKQGTLLKVTTCCEFCSRQFKSEDGLRRHLIPNHGDKIPTFLKDDPTYLQCKFCFKHFEKPTERFEHEKSHPREERPYQCPLCPQSFTSLCNRKIHELVHRVEERKPKERRNFVFSENPKIDDKKRFCITCNRGFTSRSSFNNHKQKHRMRIRESQGILSKTTISCEFCSRHFRSETGLRDHIVRHHGDKIPTSLKDDPSYLQCRFCHKQFEKPTERHRHEKSHAKEQKPYQCSICLKCFGTGTERKTHESIHKEDRPFRCSQCPNSYKISSSLSRHVRNAHSGTEAILCETSG